MLAKSRGNSRAVSPVSADIVESRGNGVDPRQRVGVAEWPGGGPRFSGALFSGQQSRVGLHNLVASRLRDCKQSPIDTIQLTVKSARRGCRLSLRSLFFFLVPVLNYYQNAPDGTNMRLRLGLSLDS